MPRRPEIDDTTFMGPGGVTATREDLDGVWEEPPSKSTYVRTQEQMDDIVKSSILSCVDQLEESLEDHYGYTVHDCEVDGILRAIDILEMMVENISATGERSASQRSQDQTQASE